MKLAVVYACTRLIAGAVMQMPFHVYARGDRGDRQRVDDDLERLLNVAPNDLFTGPAWKEYALASLLLRGNAYALIERDRNGVALAVHPLDPLCVEPKRERGRLVYEVTPLPADGEQPDHAMRFDQDDVLDFPNFGFNGTRSPSVLSAGAQRSIALQRAMDNYSRDFFERGALQSYAIRREDAWSADEMDMVRQRWVETYAQGLRSRNLPMLFPKSAAIEKLNVSAEDSQLLQSREFGINDTARAFGVASFLVQQEQKTTSWGTGVAEIGSSFLRFCLAPHVLRIETELTRKLTVAPVFVKAETAGLERATQKERYLLYKQALGGSNVPGFMSVNEVRQLEELPRLGDEYDLPYVPPVGGVNETTENSDEPMVADAA